MYLILALREIQEDISVEEMHMIADINRIILNLQFMKKLLENKNVN